MAKRSVDTSADQCLKCGKPEDNVFHRAPKDCPCEGCEYDEAAEQAHVATGSRKYPHPTPHHLYRRKRRPSDEQK